MLVKYFIFHEIIKEIDTSGSEVKLRDTTVSVEDTIMEFCKTINERYYVKNKTYGNFDNNSGRIFRQLLNRYLDKKIDFLQFTIDATNTLADSMGAQPKATGGYIVYCHFEVDNNDKFYILMLRNTEAYNINNQDLEVVEILNTHGYDVGVQIDLSDYLKNEGKYLSFLSGRKELSNYFTQFIGCTELNNPKTNAQALTNAVKDYCIIKNYDKTDSFDILNKIKAYAVDRSSKNYRVHLNSVALDVDPDEPDEFIKFASSDKFKLSHEFYVDKNEMKKIGIIDYVSDKYRIKFPQSSLRNGIIEYDERNKDLIIKNIPPDLVSQL